MPTSRLPRSLALDSADVPAFAARWAFFQSTVRTAAGVDEAALAAQSGDRVERARVYRMATERRRRPCALGALVRSVKALEVSAILTRREREILALMARGVSSNRALAARMVVTEDTVKWHMSRLLFKTETHTRLAVLAWAMRSGLTQ